MIDINEVKTKDIQFRNHHDYTKSVEEYIEYLIKLGYTDRAVLLHTNTILFDLIIAVRNKVEDEQKKQKTSLCIYCQKPITDGQRMIYQDNKPFAHYECYGKKLIKN